MSEPTQEAVLEIRDLRKSYGAVRAVDRVSLSVRAGELVSLLGPSGCGKTTTLRAVAGFEEPDDGRILIGGREVTRVPPNRRDVGMVFQGYALFPHMSVVDNVAFGLRMRKRPQAEIEPAVREALALVHLTGFESRLPKQLSGGQQQRVAVARALAIRPRILLLDEPLSNLDAKLRQEMRVELKRILKETGIATVFVTHDQEEALVLSDRIVLMNQGAVEQEGSPREIYERPRTAWAAAFIGQNNFFRGRVAAVESRGVLVLESEGVRLTGRAGFAAKVGAPAVMTVRQERVRVIAGAEAGEGDNRLPARVELLNFLGGSVQLVCTVGGRVATAVIAAADQTLLPDRGATVTLAWSEADALILAQVDGKP